MRPLSGIKRLLAAQPLVGKPICQNSLLPQLPVASDLIGQTLYTVILRRFPRENPSQRISFLLRKLCTLFFQNCLTLRKLIQHILAHAQIQLKGNLILTAQRLG